MRKQERGRGKRPREEGTAPQTTPIQPFPAIDTFQSSPQQLFNDPSYGPSPISRPDSRVLLPGGHGPPQHLVSGRPPPGKIAIPALRISNPASSPRFKKGRTSHACDHCRKAKSGCSGGQPCSRCKNAGVSCVYGDGKRDKDRKRLTQLGIETDSLTQYSVEVTDAIRRIRLDVTLSSDDIRARLDQILAMTPTPLSPGSNDRPTQSPRASSEPEESMMSGEEDVDAEVGSTGSLDVINVDADREDIRATGHMGKSSSVAWLKRTAAASAETANQDSPLGTKTESLSLPSYHTEDSDLDRMDFSNINSFEWPESRRADFLVSSYFRNTHPALPLVEKGAFMKKYERFARGSNNLSDEDSIWLGKVNMIFAISALHNQLSDISHLGDHFEHTRYLERARLLGLDGNLLYQDASISTVCATGLLCLYFISAGRLNRAWTFGGLALRNALTLGLHVRSEADETPDVEKEHRVRLWWSLYCLECSLNELTGRPTCISDRDTSTPFPININEDEFQSGFALYERRSQSAKSGHSSVSSRRASLSRPSATYQLPLGTSQPVQERFPTILLPITTSTYFIHRVQLSIVVHEIITQLYCAATAKESWSDVQSTIHRIDTRLLDWRDKLPAAFDIKFDTWSQPDFKDSNIYPRMGLAMMFSSARMILFRPCLCKFEGRIKNQSSKSKNFNQDSVEKCIESAREMINLISFSASSPETLYQMTPWWSTLHYICEALSVLMLEMAYKAQHIPNDAAEILGDAKKGVLWLRMMSGQSVSARKAWEIFDCLVRVVAPIIRWSVYDMPTDAPVPPGYNWRKFSGSTDEQSSAHHTDPHQQLHQVQQSPYQTSQSTWPSLPQQFSYAPASHAQTISTGYEGVSPLNAYSNPLDHSQALQKFQNMGRGFGLYDDSWTHMFPSSVAGEMASLTGMEMPMSTQSLDNTPQTGYPTTGVMGVGGVSEYGQHSQGGYGGYGNPGADQGGYGAQGGFGGSGMQ